MLPGEHGRQQILALVLADSDELHLRRDDAAPRVMHLRDVAARLGAARTPLEIEAHLGELGIGQPRVAVLRAGAVSSSVSLRSSIQRLRSGGKPLRMSIWACGSV